jgi:ATP-binding cassette subfamily G (WHITE) protein 2 (SNQ2)
LKERGLPPFRPPLSLSLDHLSVRGTGGAGVLFAPTVGSIFAPWSGAQDKRRAKKLERAQGLDEAEKGQADEKKGEKHGEDTLKKGERFLLHDISLLVQPGEMLLVVGRPGSGCTTLLKAIAGLKNGFSGVDGEVRYGSMDGMDESNLRPYKAAVCFNSEDDVHVSL